MADLIYIINEKTVRHIRLAFRVVMFAALVTALLNAYKNCWRYDSFSFELPVYVLLAILTAAIMNDICVMTTSSKKINNAMILAFVYVLFVFLLNNIWRYCKWQFLFGNTYIYKVFIDDLNYSCAYGWARYPALFFAAMTGLLAEHSAIRQINNMFLKYRYRKARKRNNI